jgi:hypothetical protein
MNAPCQLLDCAIGRQLRDESEPHASPCTEPATEPIMVLSRGTLYLCRTHTAELRSHGAFVPTVEIQNARRAPVDRLASVGFQVGTTEPIQCPQSEHRWGMHMLCVPRFDTLERGGWIECPADDCNCHSSFHLRKEA